MLCNAEPSSNVMPFLVIRKSSTDEAGDKSDALRTIIGESDECDKRKAVIERRLEEEPKERLEKQQELPGEIGDISNDLTKLDLHEDHSCEANISMSEKRQGNLETTVLTLNAAVDAKIVQIPSRNRCFCGRDRELETIAAQLKRTGNGCVHSAICGLGGVGKTALAVEFLCRHEDEYPSGIFWISGENNNLFQRSFSEMARQMGTFENDFSDSLLTTLDWLRRRKELWCLVVDNLDELDMSPDMRKLLTGHWKHASRGHIIITTRREVAEIGEEMVIEEQCCMELKCLTEEEGIQFLRMRTGKAGDEDSDMRELVRELGGLPLALDQAGAYIRRVNPSIKDYVKKYKEQRLLLLRKQKARQPVEHTSPERLAVNSTWLLNFDHISRISGIEHGESPTLVMQVCAFLAPDDIPYELINEEFSSTKESGLCEQGEIVSLLTQFSLFQRYGTNSFSVHRLVQEVIRSQLEKETDKELRVLSFASRVLHFALAHTRSPASVCESFSEDAVFSVENLPSLHLWGKLALHATYFQEHLRSFSAKRKESVHTLLYTEETLRVFNEAGIFFCVSQEKVKAQEMQELKLEVLVNLDRSASVDGNKLPNYFIDIPLKDRDYKLISRCMRQNPKRNTVEEADFSQTEREEEANKLREQGNLAVQRKKFEEASKLYSSAIGLSAGDYRLFCNRALCYLKLGQPQKALDDCEKCLSLNPNYSKALQRKAWALQELIKNGSTQRIGQKKAAIAMAVHFDSSLLHDSTFCEMFPDVRALTAREVNDASQLAFALMTTQANETLFLHEGEYNLNHFVTFTDLQIVGLGQGVVLAFKEVFEIVHSRCYFENIILPQVNVGLVCQGKDAAIHMNHCEISGGYSSCEDYPECNGGSGCIAASLGKPVCDRTGKFGDPESSSGVGGFPGVQIINGSYAVIEYCAVHDCGGEGILVEGEDSQLHVRKCEVYKNHQAGLEARKGGKLVASENRIFNSGYHGILIGPNAEECDISDNKIFENAREGIFAGSNNSKIVIASNDVHHNRHFGISLDDDSSLLISDNKIFENGFWGILAKSRTSANITRNVVSGNKCGGIVIGINYSGQVCLESNIIRDHSGPWLEYPKMSRSMPMDGLLFDYCASIGQGLPHGEREVYSKVPVLNQNKEFNNEEGKFHPREVIEQIYSGCTFCRRSKDEVQRLLKCSTCYIASYCCKECQRKHWPTHKTICFALKSRYSVTVNIPLFRTHLKGNGRQKFIIRVRTQTLNSHPLQLLTVYDKSRTIHCNIQSPEIFNVIMECGVLVGSNKFTSKKVFLWAMFAAESGEQLTIFLDHLAPYQEW